MQIEPEYEDTIDMPYTLSDGRKVRIRIGEAGEVIEVVTDEAEPRLVGSIELSQDEEDPSRYKLMRAYFDENPHLPGYCRQGIGRTALVLHREHLHSTIWAEPNDGHVRSDGSHLTGDAPAFVERMRKEGIINSATYCDPHWSGDEDGAEE